MWGFFKVTPKIENIQVISLQAACILTDNPLTGGYEPRLVVKAATGDCPARDSFLDTAGSGNQESKCT